MIDVNTLTLGEIEEVETRARMGIGALQDPAAPKAKLLRALVFVLMRRNDPAVRWEDTANMSMAELDSLISEDPDQGEGVG